jgi:hypothetical protein
MPTIYICAFHSQPGQDRKGASGQFASIEEAIIKGVWPYDNGDDPSFYAARHGGPLTWGVCRTDVRSSTHRGDIIVFISFTQIPITHRIAYRLCAVATVADKIAHTKVRKDPRLLSHPYINVMIRKQNGWWAYDESDRRRSARHRDWLWRIARHERSEKKESFKQRHDAIYAQSRFQGWSPALVSAENYIVFASSREETFISNNPPHVALARKDGETPKLRREHWSDKALKELTVSMGRGYLRTGNSSGPNHPHIRILMEAADVTAWRKKLIEALSRASDRIPE